MKIILFISKLQATNFEINLCGKKHFLGKSVLFCCTVAFFFNFLRIFFFKMSYTWLQGIRKLVSDVFYTFFQRFAIIRKTEAKNGKKATVQQNKMLFQRKRF